jgi:hypothetical protein
MTSRAFLQKRIDPAGGIKSFQKPVLNDKTSAVWMGSILRSRKWNRIGNKSTVFRQQILNKSIKAVCVDADITFVIADIMGKPIKLEGGLKEKLLQLPLFEG